MKAQVILVNLGSNDYSTYPHPSNQEFTDGLIQFATQIKIDYPFASLALLCPYGLTDLQCKNVEDAANATNSIYYRLNPDAVTTYGCDMHPSYESHQAWADLITPLVLRMFSLVE